MRLTPSQILGCAVALAMSFAAPAWAEDAIGQVKTSSGEVSVQHHDGKIQPLKVGDHVYQLDTISTKKGAVGITFLDNSMMSLGSGSQLALDQFHFNTRTHEGVFNTSLSKGTLAVKSGQIVQQTPEAMHVRIPAALLGVRGTEFLVHADGKS